MCLFFFFFFEREMNVLVHGRKVTDPLVQGIFNSGGNSVKSHKWVTLPIQQLMTWPVLLGWWSSFRDELTNEDGCCRRLTTTASKAQPSHALVFSPNQTQINVYVLTQITNQNVISACYAINHTLTELFALV